METQLVAEAAPVIECPIPGQQRGERTDGIRRAAHVHHRVADGAHVGRPAVCERLYGAAQVIAIVGRHLLVTVERRREEIGHVGGRERRDVHHFEAGGRVTQQSMRTRDIRAA